MISHLQMITIYVSNLERSLQFYTEMLGFKETAVFDDGVTKIAWVAPIPVLDIPYATEIGLCEVAGDDPRVGAVSGMVFTSENIKATYLELKARGVQFTKELIRHPYGAGDGDQEANFADPDGNLFLLHT
jgi:catechol 2,3-dioxygenase-like lactoylglutathione lyase family enzyme